MTDTFTIVDESGDSIAFLTRRGGTDRSGHAENHPVPKRAMEGSALSWER